MIMPLMFMRWFNFFFTFLRKEQNEFFSNLGLVITMLRSFETPFDSSLYLLKFSK